jgi:hypothetical protein
MFVKRFLMLFAFIFTLSQISTSLYGLQQAIDWDPFGSGTGTFLNPYSGTNGKITVTIEPIVIGASADVAPSASNAIAPNPFYPAVEVPISNNVGVPIMTIDTTASVTVFIKKNVVGGGPVLRENEFFFIGGYTLASSTLLGFPIDFQNSVGTVVNSFIDPITSSGDQVTFPVTGTFLAGGSPFKYVASSPALLDLTAPGTGVGGAFFLKNNSGAPIDEIQFTTKLLSPSSIYFGVTRTPEPSTYMILSSACLICAYIYRRKQRVRVKNR